MNNESLQSIKLIYIAMFEHVRIDTICLGMHLIQSHGGLFGAGPGFAAAGGVGAGGVGPVAAAAMTAQNLANAVPT